MINYFSVPTAITLEAQGADCVRYLNARLTNDIASLTPGHGCLAAALSAQGRTEGVFSIYALEEGRFLLECDGGRREDVLAALKRYVVADRVEIQDLTECFTLTHILGNDAATALADRFPNCIAVSTEHDFIMAGEILVSRKQRAPEIGFDLLTPRSQLAEITAWLKNLAARELDMNERKLLRFQANIPSFPRELNQEHLFLEAALHKAIASGKGCYVGQEVIERAQALGKPPKILRQIVIDGSAALRPGDVVSVADRPDKIGNLLNFVYDPAEKRTLCYASLRNEPLESGHQVRIGDHLGIVR